MGAQKQVFKDFSVADWVTIGNALCGVCSIFFCLNHLDSDHKLPYIDMAFIMLPLGLFFDIMDGKIARYMDGRQFLTFPGRSPFGGDLDSLSDVITFGIAPSVLAFTLGMKSMWDSMCLLFNVCCGVARLARYNVYSMQRHNPDSIASKKNDDNSNYSSKSKLKSKSSSKSNNKEDKGKGPKDFEGLPIPGNLILVALVAVDYYLCESYFCQTFEFRDPIFDKRFHPFVLCHLFFGYWMVSRLPFPRC